MITRAAETHLAIHVVLLGTSPERHASSIVDACPYGVTWPTGRHFTTF